MATTSLWRITGWIGNLVVYVENPQKTQNPRFYEKVDITLQQAQSLTNVIAYAANAEKTQGAADESGEIMEQFVSGINCSPRKARNEMLAVKLRFGKNDGTMAYHGYQSFAPGEATPAIAHEIGVRLAKELWGERYQVLVATHLDKQNHLHNHFVLNTVSFVDGKKYYRSEKDYYSMQKTSDRLCLEYGLSIVENPKRGQSKHYAEWRAEQEGRPTYRNGVKSDVDAAICEAMTEKQFFAILRSKGYDFKFGKDITILAKGRERGLKLERNFGPEYSIERIRKRILEQRTPTQTTQPKRKHLVVQYQFRGILQKTRKLKGFKALYVSYMFKMGILPKARRQQQNRPPPHLLFREDLLKIRQYDEELRLLLLYPLDTQEQLAAFITERKETISGLTTERKKLRNHLRFVTTEAEMIAKKQEISDFTKQLTQIRKEVKIGERIQSRVPIMQTKLHEVQHEERLALQPEQQTKKGRART